jgi:hypothetical protein
MAAHRRASLVFSLLALAVLGLAQAEELLTKRDQGEAAR